MQDDSARTTNNTLIENERYLAPETKGMTALDSYIQTLRMEEAHSTLTEAVLLRSSDTNNTITASARMGG